jgi:amino acid adenylation domain-containing protein
MKTMTTKPPSRLYPLTRSQTWVWAGQQLLPDSPMNNMAFAIEVAGANADWLAEAVSQMVAACDAMHLRVTVADSTPSLEFAPPAAEVPVLSLPAGAGFEEAEARSRERCATTIFDLSGQLFETAVFRYAGAGATWYLNQHHLITDGWSMSLQVSYVLKCYAALSAGKPQPEAPFRPYANYLTETPKVKESVLNYWKQQADELPAVPKLYSRTNPSRSSRALRSTTQLTTEQAARLEAALLEPEVRNWSADLARYTVFATVLFALQYRISGQSDLTLGSPAHNRVTAAQKQMPGLFMELFPQSVTIAAGETFATLLAKVRASTMDFLRYAQPGASTAALTQRFSLVLNYINRAFVGAEDPETKTSWLHSGHTEPGLHLSLQVYDFDGTGRPTLSFDVNEAIIEPQFAAEPGRLYVALLEQFLTDRTLPLNGPGTSVRAPFASGTKKDFPHQKSVVDLFYETVDQYAGGTAIEAEGQAMTYRELDERSSQLANLLLASGVGREDKVAIGLDRSLEMMIGLLGILKAGAAYVPVDPEYPSERIRYMLGNVAAQFLLTATGHQSYFASLHDADLIVLDAEDNPLDAWPTTRPTVRPAATDLMYVLHTSGSTGKPKGVMNQHDGVVNRLLWAQDHFGLRAGEDVVLQKTTFCFDVSVGELFWPLIAGAKLVFARPGGHKDDRYLREIIRTAGVTTLHFVPTMLEVFLDSPLELPSLQRVLCNGEALTVHQVNTFKERLPDTELHNLYGPTEAAIAVSHWPVPAGAEPVTTVPIGKPIANTQLYVLDEHNQPLPYGVPGELFIGGIQVARGYINQPELTADRFVTIAVRPGEAPEKLYKTGDLARLLPDGNIDFLGRIDGQVKIRGFRIELGEIASVLAEMPSVARAQVLAKDEGLSAYLAAFVVATDRGFDTAEARRYLAERLPDYMVPARFLEVPEMPLLPNGKTDRNALAAMQLESGPDTTEPEGAFEDALHDIWTEVMDADRVGVTTSFHDLGGHSLTAIRLVNRVNETFELELAANTIFRFPTIRGLAGHIEAVITKLMAEMEDE